MVEPHPTPCLSASLLYKARILGSSSRQSYVTTSPTFRLSPPKSACSGDAVLRTSTRGTVMGQCAPEDSISQCPFLQMIDTAGNPHADGSAAPGARPRHRPSRHRDPPATSRSHDNWMAARQTSCRQQTAPPQPRCSKDVTAHPHRPGARPGRPCPVPARSGQPLSGRSRFSPAFGTEFFFSDMPSVSSIHHDMLSESTVGS